MLEPLNFTHACMLLTYLACFCAYDYCRAHHTIILDYEILFLLLIIMLLFIVTCVLRDIFTLMIMKKSINDFLNYIIIVPT